KTGEEATQHYMLFPVWSTGSTNPQNKEGDVTFDGKDHESTVNLSPSSSALSREQDDMTKKKDKRKSPVDYFIGNRDFNKDFEDYSKDSSNDFSVAGPIVPTARQNYSNSTNSISAAGHTQEEGIDYEEVFAPVARIEAIRLFLTYASFMGFLVYQMDVKSAFLYGTIEEKVYVCQPLGFEDPDYPDKVYKVVKALYGLHQAPRAWYKTLGTYLLENSFHRGQIDQTLFINKQKGDILLVQIYVDDIIFGATNKDLCKSFEKLMKDKFQMSSMGEITFFWVTDGKSASTPIDTEKPLLKDPDGEDVDVHIYRSMIGSLMYLTSSRPDIMFADSSFDLVAYSDIDYAGASLDRKYTTRGCQFPGSRLISWQCKKQTVVATSSTEVEYVAGTS
nr:hypothetical protein [Tanacetum cinerariifolium]